MAGYRSKYLVDHFMTKAATHVERANDIYRYNVR